MCYKICLQIFFELINEHDHELRSRAVLTNMFTNILIELICELSSRTMLCSSSARL